MLVIPVQVVSIVTLVKLGSRKFFCSSAHADRALNAELSVFSRQDSNLEAESICGYWEGALNDRYSTVPCVPGRRGQYVQITLRATTSINFHEIEVHGF